MRPITQEPIKSPKNAAIASLGAKLVCSLMFNKDLYNVIPIASLIILSPKISEYNLRLGFISLKDA